MILPASHSIHFPQPAQAAIGHALQKQGATAVHPNQLGGSVPKKRLLVVPGNGVLVA
jgi:hypothetical protein